MEYDPYRALYIHVPFCVRKCSYCDFHSHAAAAGSCEMDEYLESMVTAIRRSSKAGLLGHLNTVYIGGGTPSHLGMSRLSQLLYTLSLSMHLTPDVECTMEANPESLDERMVRDIFALGVTRVSLGVQSFDDSALRLLGRPHDAQQARRAVRALKSRFDNFSIDLMCGIPGQTIEMLEGSVREAVSLGVPHVSVYPLTIEEGTVMASMLEEGLISEPDSEVAADHMEAAARILKEAGYRRYEVASYAMPGYECRHNIAYWTGVPYLGLGEGAVTMRQSADTRERVMGGEVLETLDARQALAEDLMLGMRMARGVSKEDVLGASIVLDQCVETFDRLVDLGLAKFDQGRFKPTELGWLCGNEIYGRILELAP